MSNPSARITMKHGATKLLAAVVCTAQAGMASVQQGESMEYSWKVPGQAPTQGIAVLPRGGGVTLELWRRDAGAQNPETVTLNGCLRGMGVVSGYGLLVTGALENRGIIRLIGVDTRPASVAEWFRSDRESMFGAIAYNELERAAYVMDELNGELLKIPLGAGGVTADPKRASAAGLPPEFRHRHLRVSCYPQLREGCYLESDRVVMRSEVSWRATIASGKLVLQEVDYWMRYASSEQSWQVVDNLAPMTDMKICGRIAGEIALRDHVSGKVVTRWKYGAAGSVMPVDMLDRGAVPGEWYYLSGEGMWDGAPFAPVNRIGKPDWSQGIALGACAVARGCRAVAGSEQFMVQSTLSTPFPDGGGTEVYLLATLGSSSPATQPVGESGKLLRSVDVARRIEVRRGALDLTARIRLGDEEGVVGKPLWVQFVAISRRESRFAFASASDVMGVIVQKASRDRNRQAAGVAGDADAAELPCSPIRETEEIMARIRESLDK